MLHRWVTYIDAVGRRLEDFIASASATLYAIKLLLSTMRDWPRRPADDDEMPF